MKTSSNESGSLKTLVVLLYALGMTIPVLMALQPVEVALRHFLYDDFFYYIKIAEHIMENGVASFDGESPTNGFHPLWMLLILGVRSVMPDSMLVTSVLFLAVMLHWIQVWLVYKIISYYSGRTAGHFAALFYLFNYRIIEINLCGLESPLSVAAILCTIYFLVKYKEVLTIRNAAVLGAILGLAVLSRFDNLILVGVVVVYLVLNGRVPLRREGLPVIGSLVVCFGLVTIGWFVWSIENSNSMLPNSKTALDLFTFKSLSFQKSWALNYHILSDKIKYFPYMLMWLGNTFGIWPSADFRLLPGMVYLAFWVVMLSWLVYSIGHDHRNDFLFYSLLYAIAHAGYYLIFALWSSRYLFPVIVVAFINAAIVMARISSLYPWKKLIAAVIIVCFAIMVYAGNRAWHNLHVNPFPLLNYQSMLMAKWISKNTGAHVRIGSWNAGILSYFSDRTVVNLDGVVNDQAIDAMINKRIDHYIEEKRLDYLVDLYMNIEKYTENFGQRPDWVEGHTEKIFKLESITVLRINNRPVSPQ